MAAVTAKTLESLMETIGHVYSRLGLYDESESLLQRSLAQRRKHLGDDHPDTLSSMHHLAHLYFYQGLWNEAEPLLRRSRPAMQCMSVDLPDPDGPMMAVK